MRKLFLQILIFVNTFLLVFSILISKVSAQGFLPDFFENLLEAGAGRSSDFANSRVQLMLLMILGVIIITASFYAFMAAWKYIRSQGDQSQIDEATKALKAIFMGMGSLLVSIVGIVLVFVFFGATLFGGGTFQTCMSAPNTIGCVACNEPDGGLPPNWTEMRLIERNPELKAGEKVAAGSSWGPGTDITSQQICKFCEYEYYQKGYDEIFPNIETAKVVCQE